MGIVFRQSIKSTLAISAGALLGVLFTYFSTKFIPMQELGFRNNLTNQAVVGGQILLLGLHNMLSVYIHRYTDRDRRKPALVTISMVLPFIIISIISLIYLLFKDTVINWFQPQDIPFIRRYFLWLPVYILLFTYQVMLETYLISQLKVAKATFIREVLLRALNIGLLLLFAFGFVDFDTLIYGTVLLYIVPIVLLLILAFRTDAFRFSFDWSVFSKEEKKEIVHFTWYHSLLSMSLTLMGMLDALMVAVLSPSGLSAVAIYSVVVVIISFLLIPYRAMLNSIFPILAQAFADNDMGKVKDIFMRSSINILIASGAMLLIVCCNLHNATAILPEGYGAVGMVVIILAAGRIVDMATGINDQVLSISKHYKYNFYISLLLVAMMVGLNWWLIPIYDVYGAAWGTTIALVVFNLLKLFIVKAKLGLQPFSSGTVKVAITLLIVFGINYLLPRLENAFVDTAYRSGIIIVAYGTLLLVIRPSPDLNAYVASVKKNKRLF
jgi:O-antigen/teichoic acid export membrane protein